MLVARERWVKQWSGPCCASKTAARCEEEPASRDAATAPQPGRPQPGRPRRSRALAAPSGLNPFGAISLIRVVDDSDAVISSCGLSPCAHPLHGGGGGSKNSRSGLSRPGPSGPPPSSLPSPTMHSLPASSVRRLRFGCWAVCVAAAYLFCGRRPRSTQRPPGRIVRSATLRPKA